MNYEKEIMRLILIATLVIASKSLQWCHSSHGRLLIQKRSIVPSAAAAAARRRSFVHDGLVRPATSTSTSSSSQTHLDDVRESTVQVFLRCSPLIGGPSILPLHVEVILAEDKDTKRSIDDRIYIRKTNDLAYLMNTYPQLHRFDFLPENPKTLQRLFHWQLFNRYLGSCVIVITILRILRQQIQAQMGEELLL